MAKGELLRVQTNIGSIDEITVNDLFGKRVFSTTTGMVDTKFLSAGMYILTVTEKQNLRKNNIKLIVK